MAIDNVARALALQGVPGVGIASITFDSDVPQGKRYKITLTDGTFYYFIVPAVSVATTGSSTDDVYYISVDGTQYRLPKTVVSDTGTAVDFVEYITCQGVEKKLPKTTVNSTGTATDEVKYITCQDVEKKLYAGVDYDSTDTEYPTKIKYVASLPASPDPHTLYIIPE